LTIKAQAYLSNFERECSTTVLPLERMAPVWGSRLRSVSSRNWMERFPTKRAAWAELVVRATAEGFSDGKVTVKLAGADAQAHLTVEPNGFITGRVTGFDKAATIKDLREDGRSALLLAPARTC
jgi:hypothetical protein